jgi:hypothetical protein
MSNKCARMECEWSTMLKGCLVLLLHALRGPFYSPKAARSRWEQSGKAILAFCRLAHRTVRCTTGHCPVWISFFIWRSRPLAALEPLAHRTLSGAHRTVRCPLLAVGSATCPARITRPTVGSPDSPVNFSRTPLITSREQQVRLSLPGAPKQSWLWLNKAIFTFDLIFPVSST